MSESDAISPVNVEPVPLIYENLRPLTLDQLCAADHRTLKNLFTTAPEKLRNKHSSVPRSAYKLFAIVLAWLEQLIVNENDLSGDGNDETREMDQMFSLSVNDLETMAHSDLPKLVKLATTFMRLGLNLTPRVCDFNERASVCGRF